MLQHNRYGNIDELKETVKKFHEVGFQVLGDVVLNHRCAHYQNQNGVWNIFGGRLNWDDRAVVADDPHFQVSNMQLCCKTFCTCSLCVLCSIFIIEYCNIF